MSETVVDSPEPVVDLSGLDIEHSALRLIEYAAAANDSYLKGFVRQGYEYMRSFGLSRIGMWGENMVNNMMASVAIEPL